MMHFPWKSCKPLQSLVYTYSSHIFAMVSVKFRTLLNAPNIILFHIKCVLYNFVYFNSANSLQNVNSERETRTKMVNWNEATIFVFICNKSVLFWRVGGAIGERKININT